MSAIRAHGVKLERARLAAPNREGVSCVAPEEKGGERADAEPGCSDGSPASGGGSTGPPSGPEGPAEEPSENPDAGPRSGDLFKTSVAAASNLLFLPAVSLLWVVEQPLFNAHQLAGSYLLVFIVGELTLTVYYLLAQSDSMTRMLDLFTQAARSGISAEDVASVGARKRPAGRLHRILTNLWTPVTLNFWLVGFLIYATGGITRSPYSQVPVSMIIIGQSVYAVPPIRLRPSSRAPRPVVFILSVARLYWSSLVVVVSLLTALVLLQRYAPIVSTSAPAGEIFLVMLVSLLASMCVTFLTRRADRHGGGRAGR
jgi:hypothetical protein